MLYCRYSVKLYPVNQLINKSINQSDIYKGVDKPKT